MYEQVEKTPEKKSQMAANAVSQRQNSNTPTSRYVDNRPEAIQMRRLRELAKNSPQNAKLRELHHLVSGRMGTDQPAAPIQRKWSGEIPKNAQDTEVFKELKELRYQVENLKTWKIRELRVSDTPYDSYRAIASALGLTSSSGAASFVPSDKKDKVIIENIELLKNMGGNAAEAESAATATTMMNTTLASGVSSAQEAKATSMSAASSSPVVPERQARSIAQSFMMAADSKARENASQRGRPMIDTGRVKIYAPVDEQLTVYRAEKSERVSLEKRRQQGGLEVWCPSTQSVQEAYNRMFKLISKGEILRESEFNAALSAYAQTLRAQGQPDNLATARTIEGAFNDDYNYTIKIPGVRLFKWTPTGIGERIAPGKEIKQHYIVLNADTIENSTIFGIGHITGTQEVSFYSKIPGDMIESVQERDFNAAAQKFTVVQTPA